MTRSAASTWVARLTPLGRGAVATVAVVGPHAVEFCGREFRAVAGSLEQQPIGRILFGNWGAEPGEELIVGRRSADELEIHCHGGQAAVARIIDSLVAHGCQEISWQELLSLRGEGAISLAARTALAEARTEQAARVLLDQLDGAFERELTRIANACTRGDFSNAQAAVQRLLDRAPLGLHLTIPWRVVLAGPPNAGKSSLINALVGFQRSLVFEQPGTTRDVVSAVTALGGWPVELFDTAGLRSDAEPLEHQGIELARQQLGEADLVVLVFDQSQPWSAEQQALCDAWPSAIIVHNKCDLPSAPQFRPTGLLVSALHGTGKAELADAIIARLVPVTPPPGTAIPFTAEQVAALSELQTVLSIRDTTQIEQVLLHPSLRRELTA